jgi:hypothetical protein
MDQKQELLERLEKKMAQLHHAENEYSAWSNGKYKKSSNAANSKIYVQSLRKEVDELRQQIGSDE